MAAAPAFQAGFSASVQDPWRADAFVPHFRAQPFEKSRFSFTIQPPMVRPYRHYLLWSWDLSTIVRSPHGSHKALIINGIFILRAPFHRPGRDTSG